MFMPVKDTVSKIIVELDYFDNSFSVTLPVGDYDAEQVDSAMFFVLDSIDGLVDVMEPTVLK